MKNSAKQCTGRKWTAIPRDSPAIFEHLHEKINDPFDVSYGSLTNFFPKEGMFEFTFKNTEECDQLVTEWNASCVDPVSAIKVIRGAVQFEKGDEGEVDDEDEDMEE